MNNERRTLDEANKRALQDEYGEQLFGTFVRETDKAELWETHEFGERWIPKSQLIESYRNGGRSYVTVSGWLYRKLESES
jgi:hypothetical protein